MHFKVGNSQAFVGATSLEEIHENLGHVNKITLNKMIANKVVEDVDQLVGD